MNARQATREVASGCVLRPTRGLRTELLDDELLLYRAEHTRIVALNPTASLIWSLCDGERSLAEVERLLVGAYPDAAAEISTDLVAAVEQLVGEGVLELAETLPPEESPQGRHDVSALQP